VQNSTDNFKIETQDLRFSTEMKLRCAVFRTIIKVKGTMLATVVNM
jgi:hypothetical protein